MSRAGLGRGYISVILALPIRGCCMPFSFTLCADDYAISPGVSRGIREALAAGRLNAAGCMTNMGFWPQEAASLIPLARQAGIGLHLNLTAGRPLTAMPVLAPQGTFAGLGPLMAFSRRGKLPEGEIAGEIGAQIDAFLQHFGRAPDFVDGHQHVQILAGIDRLLLAELKRRNLAGKLWLRDSSDRVGRILARRSCLPKALGLAWLARGFAGQAQAAGFAVNDGFAGFSAFDPRRDFAGDFARYLIAPGARHLVMCHPGRVDDALREVDPVLETREQELAFLLSDEFWNVLGRAGAKLATAR